MTNLAVITPSYAADFELCRDLNASVLALTPSAVVHYIVTPRTDQSLFAPLRGGRTEVLAVDDLLPRRVIRLARSNYWINLHRPFPPIRGWIMQQVLKLQAAVDIESDILLMVDSDISFVRPITAESYMHNGKTFFYRKPNAIDDRLPRHLAWQISARRLLGAPGAEAPFSDYVHAPCFWERSTVLAMIERIEKVTGRSWLDAVAGELHVSECILYGVFVDEILRERSHLVPVESMFCHNYYDCSPLSLEKAQEFANLLPPDDFAMMISAKSHTPLGVRRAAFSQAVAKAHLP